MPNIYVGASYRTYSDTKLEIEFEWSEVKEWWLRWNTLHIVTNDGTEHEFELSFDFDTETKRPVHARIAKLNDDGEEIEELDECED